MTIGQRIKQARENKQLSQGDLAKIMGISRQAVSKAELLDKNVTTDKIRKYAYALGVAESYLMGYDEDVAVYFHNSSDSIKDSIAEYYQNKELNAVAIRYKEAPEPIKEAVCKLLDVDRAFFSIDKFKKGDEEQ